MSKKFSHLSVFAAIFALCLMVASPAFAHHKDDHTQGGGKTSSSGSDHDGDGPNDDKVWTEDNDENDGDTPNNVADDGDNAHPSGKDRSVENGGSGNQGKSESNPDDSKGPMRYEGAQGDDKPQGPGGTDLADQDGNNGCGNDDDFNDDNNGWCGKNPKRGGSKPPKTPEDEVKGGRTTKTCPNGAVMPVNEPCSTETPGGGDDVDEDDEVLPDVDTNPSITDDVRGTRIDRAAQPAAPSVLGVRLSPALSEPVAVAGAVLPFTGGELLVFLAAALGLIAAGAVALRLRSNES